MEKYKNIHGESGVTAFEVGEASIKVQFQDGTVYLYTYKSAGKGNIEKMKKLAKAGKGLSTFISTIVKDRYESKG